MATRPTKTQTAQAIPEAAHEPEASTAEMLRSFAAMAGVKIPSGRQLLLGLVVAVVTSVAGAYATSAVASYLAVGALMLTGSAFLSLLMMVLTYAVGIYLTLKLSSRLGTWAATASIGDDLSATKNWISDKFSGLKDRLTPVGA